LQAAASRLLFSFGRDRMIFGHSMLGAVSTGAKVPVAALMVCAVLPMIIVVIGRLREDALTVIISFAAIGIYIAFQMVVAGALMARARGWVPSGPFRLGAWGVPVTIVALCFGLAAIANMAWPRGDAGVWYLDYAVAMSSLAVIALGMVYLAVRRLFSAQ